ncbi:MAG TPA: BREX-2 system phosphatase PglZ [Pyrinomonadaceae bacterium]
MSSYAVTPSQVRTQIALVQKHDERNNKSEGSRFIGVKTAGDWHGEETLVVGGIAYRVIQCGSVLEVREALARAEGSRNRLVILTGLEQSELGDDVLARLAKRCLFTPRPWPSVIELFQARRADPNLLSKRWLADALLENAPPQGYPPVPGGVLDEETVWGTLLRDRFNLYASRPDTQDLLEWTLEADNIARYESATPELRKGLQEWASRSTGRAGDLIFRCVDTGFGRDAVAIGVACQVIFGGEDVSKLTEATVRFERYVGDGPVPAEGARQWASAAGSVVERLAAQGRQQTLQSVLARSDEVLAETRVEEFARLGRYSPAGFEQRLALYGGRLQASLERDITAVTEDLKRLADDILEHWQARRDSARAVRVEMSLRLLRWLALPATVEAASLEQAARAYCADGGFVDWARNQLYGGERLGALSKAYETLARVAGERRERENRRFAELLANWTELGSPGESVLKIENVLGKVVARLGASTPVLLIVVDGMGWAVTRELLADITSRGWVELGPESVAWPPPVISALPSVTEASRTSLLCGRLATGSSHDEVGGFKVNEDLVKVSRAGSPPVLYHKGTLSDSPASGLTAHIRDEITSPKRQVVGVVVNAVDDFLGKGDQVAVAWTLESMPVLDQLLYAARDAGRAVVITSDHGHVLERQTVYRKADAGERYRGDDGRPLDGEMAVVGDRVLLPPGGRLIAPWSENVRYGARKHGYHGGLTPQECVVPVAVVTWPNRVPVGWCELPGFRPTWWDVSRGGADVRALRDVAPPTVRDKVNTHAVHAESLPLFAVEETPRATVGWIEALLASPTFESQGKLAGRAAPTPELVRAFMAAIEESGGVIPKGVLARKMGQPELRINGILAAMRRLLNVEGYGVLSVDDASGTVSLNTELLRVQFEL